MSVRYFCDGCGSQINDASKINPMPIAHIQIVTPSSTRPTNDEPLMMCSKCTVKLMKYIDGLKKENGIISVGKGFNIKTS